jgi:hypothetical protein
MTANIETTRPATWRVWTAVVAIVLTGAAAANGQPADPARNPSSALGVSVGLASVDGDPGTALAAAAAWGIRPRVGMEARVLWLDRPRGEEAYGASLSVQWRLAVRGRAVPFLKTGFGLHVASFDGRERPLPGFYGRRLGPEAAGHRHSFHDPVIVVGGGVDVRTSRFLTWRPEVESFVVVAGSRARTVFTASLQVGFQFEPNRVTPARRAAGR